MNTRRRDGFPADLAQVCRRFEHSRRSRKARSRIPEPLWALAVKMAGRHGINRTAKALRVDYYSLKKRIERKPAADLSPASASASRGRAATAFFELPPFVSATSGEGASRSCDCTLEMEDAASAKLRLHLQGVAAPDLAMLCRSFRSCP
jgi:hypothetical protein